MRRHVSDHVNGHHPSLSPSLQTESQLSYSTQADISCALSQQLFKKKNPYFEDQELQENKLGATE